MTSPLGGSCAALDSSGDETALRGGAPNHIEKFSRSAGTRASGAADCGGGQVQDICSRRLPRFIGTIGGSEHIPCRQECPGNESL